MDLFNLLSIVISVTTSAIPFVQRAIDRRRKARERQRFVHAAVVITFGAMLIWTLTRKR